MGDSSTIDFMYIPDFDPDMRAAPVELRVPILPFTQASAATKAEVTEAEPEVGLILSILLLVGSIAHS